MAEKCLPLWLFNSGLFPLEVVLYVVVFATQLSTVFCFSWFRVGYAILAYCANKIALLYFSHHLLDSKLKVFGK